MYLTDNESACSLGVWVLGVSGLWGVWDFGVWALGCLDLGVCGPLGVSSLLHNYRRTNYVFS